MINGIRMAQPPPAFAGQRGMLNDLLIPLCRTSEARWEVRTIDFDWAGVEGSATYPPMLNHRSITWPEGVVGGAKIRRAHDDLHIGTIIGRPPACARPSQARKQQETVSRYQAQMIRNHPHMAVSRPRRLLHRCHASRQSAQCAVRFTYGR